MQDDKVTFYDGATKVLKKVITPKNLGWVIKNMSHIEKVTLSYQENDDKTLQPCLFVSGSRNGDYFCGSFPFASQTVMREWANKRRYFRYIGIEDRLI